MEKLVFAGNGMDDFTAKVCVQLGVEPGKINRQVFSDGEMRPQFLQNIRGRHVFIVQSTHPPADNLMSLLLMLDAAKLASAKRITAVVPYSGYMRQDRKDRPRTPISGKLCAELIKTAGINDPYRFNILTMDLHSNQAEAFFWPIPVNQIYARNDFLKKIVVVYGSKDLAFSAPDTGAASRARSLAKRASRALGKRFKYLIMDKYRSNPNEAEIIHVVGDTHPGQTVVIVDDLIDTGKTANNCAKVLKERRSAESVIMFSAHGVLSGEAIKVLDDGYIDKIYITDSIPRPNLPPKFEIISVTPLFADAIDRIYSDKGSISQLIEGDFPE